jgi:hypothetical protein
MSKETLQIVVNSIQLKGNQDGEAYTTRVIRKLTRNELRDKEKGTMDLTSHTTKRELYKKYFFDRGWAIKSDTMGHYPKVKYYVSRQEDDMFWPSGAVVNTSGQAGTQIPHLPLGDDSSPRGR